MPDNGKTLAPLNGKDNDLVVASGRGLPHGYPFDTVSLALALCAESRSAAEGHRRLKAELEPRGLDCPEYWAVWNWVKQSRECYQAVTGVDRKREMIAIASDVADAWAVRSLEAAQATDKEGRYEVTHRESAYHYNVAMQRRTDWDKVGQPGPAVAVQFVLRTSSDEQD